jgi:hypothetical protein
MCEAVPPFFSRGFVAFTGTTLRSTEPGLRALVVRMCIYVLYFISADAVRYPPTHTHAVMYYIIKYMCTTR